MTDHRLYTVTIPGRSDMEQETNQRRNISELQSVAGGSTAVEPLGLSAGERVRQFQFGGYNDHVMAEMAAELAESDEMEAVPFYGVGPDGAREQTREDGYYSVSSAIETRPDPRASDFPTVDVTMKRVGTKKTVWRELAMKGTVVENQWGNDDAREVGIPTNATKVRWWDRDISLSGASPVRTVTAEFGDVDIYDESNSPYSRSSLIFELPYEEEGGTDPNAWDTLGNDNRTSTKDGKDALEWMKVFSTAHEFRGDAVLSNERVRATIDEDNRTISAEEYTSGSWSDITLPASDWEPLDVDLTTLDFSRVHGRLEFENASSGDIYRLGMVLARGATGFVFYVPENLISSQGGVPSGLESLLDPIASERIVIMNSDQSVVKRSEVHG